MQPIEIIVIAACSLIVAGVIIAAVIRKKKGKTSCGCDCSSCPGHCRCAEDKKPKERHK